MVVAQGGGRECADLRIKCGDALVGVVLGDKQGLPRLIGPKSALAASATPQGEERAVRAKCESKTAAGVEGVDETALACREPCR